MPSTASPWFNSLAAVAAVSLLPFLVTLMLARREVLLRRILPGLSAFGAGAVFAAAVGHIIPESLSAGQPVAMVLAWVAVGYGLFWGIERLLAGHDHAHAHGVALGAPSAHQSDASDSECVHLHPTPPDSAHSVLGSRALVPMTFAGDALHNLVDGMLIAAGFLAGTSIGVLTLIAVALHELPRELGTFGLFVHGGIRPMRAVVYNLLTAVLAMVGAVLTLVAGERIATLSNYLLPIAAGTYLYIAATVGRAALRDRHSGPARWTRLGWSGLGIAITLGSALL